MSDTNQTQQTEQQTELTPEQKQSLEHGRRMEGLDERFDDPAVEAGNKEKEKQTEDKSKTPEPEPKKDDEVVDTSKEDDGKWKDEYVTIDNPYAQSAINLLKEAKVSPVEANDIFQKAIESSDLSKVDWARLEKLVGPDKALLIKQGVTSYYDGEYKTQQETVKKGHEAFGGQEGWEKARGFFQKLEKTNPEFAAKMPQFRQMLDMGGWAAERAIGELKEIYSADPNNSGTRASTKNLEKGNGVARDNNGALTKEQYRAEIEKITDTYSAEGQRKYQELRARRALGMQNGI